MLRKLPAVLALILILTAVAAHAAGNGEPGRAYPVRAELRDKATDLALLRLLDIDVEAVFDGWARLYVLDEEYEKLEQLGFVLTVLPDEGAIGLARLAEEGIASKVGRSIPAQYHTYQTLTDDMAQIAADHPDITELTSAGLSVQGRNLWVMKITDNPGMEEDEPEIAYISSMHGDEVVGKEMVFNLINYITDGYGTDPRLTDLVDNTEIWIMPSMNPDGTELGQRYNANGVDLNRNFPDQFVDPVNTTDGRQPETAAIMTWTLDRTITLSANFHCGVLVANYPFDSNPQGASVFSPTPDPDHPAFYSISRTYADNNPAMYASTGGSFDHGVTNGADWYSINGGMQDWRYVWHGGFEVTMEVSNSDWPPASTLPDYWDDNLESMLAYFERVYEGLRGIVTDSTTGEPVAAEIRLDSNPFPVYTDPDVGDYHRIVLPGTYDVEVSAPGYVTRVINNVSIPGGDATRLDLTLDPVPGDLQPTASRVEDGAGGNGALDPGETDTLAVTLQNLGRTATGVVGHLEPTGWLVGVTRPDATYPDIPMEGERESEPPHFEVDAPVSVPVGHKAGFAVRWESAEGHGLSEPFFLDVGQPTCDTVTATDVPQTVSYIHTAVSQVQVPPGEVTGVRVGVDIRHGYIGELQVVLTSATGTEVVLHDGTGGSADDIVGTYPVDLTPAEPLDVLDGEEGSGTWTLTVSDSALVNTGTLESWTLEFCSYPMEPTPEMKFRELSVRPDGALLQWWPYPGLTSYKIYRSTVPTSAGAFANVTAEDGDPTDTRFLDTSADGLVFYLVTGIGPAGEGPKGHYGE